jgi:hypothetical protein
MVQQARKQIKQQRRAQSQSNNRAAAPQSCNIGTADQLGQGLAIEKPASGRAAQQSCTIGKANHWVKGIPGMTREPARAQVRSLGV